MSVEDDRAFLASTSIHPERPGDTAYMNPAFVGPLANAIRQARAQGLNVGIESGFRPEGLTGSRYDAGGNSAHTYGLASDISGLDGPNGPKTLAWAKIASANGLSNPYGAGNAAEFNHWQLPKQPLETTPQLLAGLKRARATGNVNNVWNAYSSTTPGGTNVASTTPAGPDNRKIVFDTLVTKAGLTPNQALGALWGLGGESGPGLNANAYNPNDPGGAIGMGQWVGTRQVDLKNFAAQEKKDWRDPQLQADFIVHELQTTDTGQAVLASLKQTNNPADATRVWVRQYERPKVDNSESRIASGAKVGSVDANNNFIPGTEPSSSSSTPAQPGGTSTTPGTQTPGTQTPPPLTPMQSWGMSVGDTLARLGTSMGGGGAPVDAPDPPPIHTMAMDMPGPQTDRLTPGAQLGSSVLTPLTDPNVSITQGAPGMTQLMGSMGGPGNFGNVGNIGMPSTYNMYDPRATQTPATAMRTQTRLF